MDANNVGKQRVGAVGEAVGADVACGLPRSRYGVALRLTGWCHLTLSRWRAHHYSVRPQNGPFNPKGHRSKGGEPPPGVG
jgi:hypothetical protein